MFLNYSLVVIFKSKLRMYGSKCAEVVAAHTMPLFQPRRVMIWDGENGIGLSRFKPMERLKKRRFA